MSRRPEEVSKRRYKRYKSTLGRCQGCEPHPHNGLTSNITLIFLQSTIVAKMMQYSLTKIYKILHFHKMLFPHLASTFL